MLQLLMTFFLSSFLAQATTYELADLEILVQEGAYSEFFAHALDIRPSERQDKWKAMVIKMGDGLGQKILKQTEITKKDYVQIEELFNWPTLKADDVFRLRRNQIGMSYLKTCLKGENPCWNDVKSFWEKDKSDTDTAIKIAEMSLSYPNSSIATWSLLETALKSPLSEFYCKKPFVMDALWGKIEMDYIKLGVEGDLMVKIDQTIHPDCVPILVQEARKRLFSPPKTFDRELSFQILKSQLKADQSTMDFFYTVYLLENPSQGELFNYSWNRVRELGGTVTRRELVLKKLKSLDPLPDSILASLDEKKKRVVLNHFKIYFPEYLDFYSDQCIEYYGGKGSFPSGNPTMQCHNFMKSELAPQIIDQYKIKRFEEVKKI